jgi:hypothetical protein
MKSWVLRILLAVAGGFLLLPLDASAQASAKVYRIGVLDMTPPDLSSPIHMAFYEELRKRGYVEGQNLVVERRNAGGQIDQLPTLARELVALHPDLIVASAPPTSSSKARNPATWRSSSRHCSIWSSISRRLRRSASRFRNRCCSARPRSFNNDDSSRVQSPAQPDR